MRLITDYQYSENIFAIFYFFIFFTIMFYVFHGSFDFTLLLNIIITTLLFAGALFLSKFIINYISFFRIIK